MCFSCLLFHFKRELELVRFVYVCVCVCLRACVHMCMCVCVSMLLVLHLCVYRFVFSCVCVCMHFWHEYVCMCIHLFSCVCVFMRTRILVLTSHSLEDALSCWRDDILQFSYWKVLPWFPTLHHIPTNGFGGKWVSPLCQYSSAVNLCVYLWMCTFIINWYMLLIFSFNILCFSLPQDWIIFNP